MVSWLGYGIAVFAPGIYKPGEVYTVTHNIIRSHVKAYHTYNDNFKHLYHGMYANFTHFINKHEKLLSQSRQKYKPIDIHYNQSKERAKIGNLTRILNLTLMILETVLN